MGDVPYGRPTRHFCISCLLRASNTLSASSMFCSRSESPLSRSTAVHGCRLIASTSAATSSESPCRFLSASGATFSSADWISPLSDKNSSLATGSRRIFRSCRMSLELVIFRSLIFLTIESRTVGVTSFLFRFLISPAQVMDAPGDLRFAEQGAFGIPPALRRQYQRSKAPI